MEISLLIVVIILLLIQSSKQSKASSDLKKDMTILNKNMNSLYKKIMSQQAIKPIEKEVSKVIIEETVVKSQNEPTIKPVVEKVPENEQKAELIAPTKVIVKTQEIKIAEKEEKSVEKEPVLAASKNIIRKAPPTPKKTVPAKPKPSILEVFKQKNPDLEKFIGENLINKLGILILVLGISYFVKFAIDKDWINEPARVGIGILAGSLVLFIANKLRKKYAPFSSVLVAGGIAIYYFTIGIAFHEYELFGQEVAFGIMVFITAFSSLISLSYNRMELAILTLIAGFSVPFMVSTGNSGNYIVLFTYIAILDIGILAIAYFKKWQPLHILSFVFTMLLFSSWVLNDVKEESPHYIGALIFAFVFYLLFIIINIINNLRSKGNFSNIQLGMLTINNFIFYGIGMIILTIYKPELCGLFTAFLAILNIGYSLLLFKMFGLDKRGVYLMIGLSLTFITLAIPVQFSGNNITVFWAVEAVLLMWLAKKTQVKSYRFTAVLVQLLMLGSLILDWYVYFDNSKDFSIVINPIFIGGILAISSFIGINYLLYNETEKFEKFGLKFNPILYRKITGVLAIVVGYLVGLYEVIYQSFQYYNSYAVLSISVFYHLLFTAVFCFVLFRERTTKNDKVINIVTIASIVTFVLFFMRIPFTEFQINVLEENNTHIAYYLHMLSLVFIMVFCYFIYHTNRKQKVFTQFNHKFTPWIAIIVLVIISSTELILQGLHLMSFSIVEGIDFDDKYELISDAKNNLIKTALPVLWGILAFILLLLGIKKQIKQLRIIALALLGFTILKLFIYDIKNVSETGKIIAFILLGVLILVISFVYQKIKVLVIDDEKNTSDEKID
jgi:uncharacterized membrane protein